MIEVFKFYFGIISDLLGKVMTSFQITEDVNYLQFFVAVMIIVAFISLLRFSFESDGLIALKDYKRNESLKSAKHVYTGSHSKYKNSVSNSMYVPKHTNYGKHGKRVY